MVQAEVSQRSQHKDEGVEGPIPFLAFVLGELLVFGYVLTVDVDVNDIQQVVESESQNNANCSAGSHRSGKQSSADGCCSREAKHHHIRCGL